LVKDVKRMSEHHAAWPALWNLALTDAALKEASSAAIFSRALSYAGDGSVKVIEEDPMPQPSLRAFVHGSQAYTTEVWIEDDALEGECDCPHADEGWFCKHLVALALVWRQRLEGAVDAHRAAARGTAKTGQQPAKTAKARRAALHDFLHTLDAAALAEKLLGLADQHPEVQLELSAWQERTELQESADSNADPSVLKAMVSNLMNTERDWMAWGESANFLNRAEAVLPLLKQTRLRDPNVAIELSLHALREAWQAMEQADDSDGAIGDLCQSIAEEWHEALEAAGPQAASFGDAYLQLHLDDPYESFDASRAEAAMGVVALSRFRELLAERWRVAKDARRAIRSAQAELAAQSTRKARAASIEVQARSDYLLDSLERMHLSQLEQTDQVEAALDVLMEDLTEPSSHSRVIAFLERHQRFGEALEHAQSARVDLPDDWRLEADLLRCVEREGLNEQAFVMRQAQFERSPSVERYQSLLQAGARAGLAVNALRLSLFKQIEAQEMDDFKRGRRSPNAATWRSGSTAARGPDVSLRAAILCAELRWIEALALVQSVVRGPASCDPRHLERIAVNLPKEHASEAVTLLQRVFDGVMQHSSSPYQEALSLVKQIGQRLDVTRRHAWLLELRMKYKAKRNFIRDLPARW
jgi:uncharacterized Zn finger protein